MAGSGKEHLRPDKDPLLVVEDLIVEFPAGRDNVVHAVSGISFDILKGETLGIVGESGCGKSTTARAIMQLPPPTSGQVTVDGVELTSLGDQQMRAMRPALQMVFQDPISSLNPRRKVTEVVARGLVIQGVDKATSEQRARDMLAAVGLEPDSVGDRRPSEFSGGQAQRICIARALVLDPKLVVCDEPVSALDVSVQAQILNLLRTMKSEYGLTMAFIAHDLAVVKNISDRVLVMYLGKICEVGHPDAIYEWPAHPYTSVLLEAIPRPDPVRSRPENLEAGIAELPSPINPPSGCRFRTRCPKAQQRCAEQEPMLRPIGDDHFVACHFPDERSSVPPEPASS